MAFSFITKVKMASRNILKNKRRSVVTLLSISIGFIALSLFEGYFTYIYRSLEQEAIIGERLGHLTIVKTDFYEKGSVEPKKYVFDSQELETMTERLVQVNGIKMISPRLHINGLISNGDVSHIFLSEGILADDLLQLRKGDIYEDAPGYLDPTDDRGAVLSSGLAKMLDVDPDNYASQDLVIVAATIDGMMSASDVNIADMTDTGSVATNDKFVLIPLDLARELYDVEGADRVIILMETPDQAEAAMPNILALLEQSGLDVEIKDWKELSMYYSQVKGLFDMMHLFISLVVVLVVLFSVLNTMGQAIVERTREIGTLRAIGMKERTLTGLFVYEGMLLVAIGSVVGLIATYIIGGAINYADIRYLAPDSSSEVNLIIDLLIENLISTSIVFIALAAFASYLPAKKAAKKPITEALGHV
ncbi:ABC transporter permease [Photobacterium lutimaris]|uniref:ABC transporter permease n=1 Tax=Photobacterium lutimaris TaxID=388278 RepID=A0A2T3IYK6_9GAMM|nr:ABC transporter permease [Photobacterium lutimaris]TDR74488.1 putative ABC transport system permease protein [Photobacterium lutimaris]